MSRKRDKAAVAALVAALAAWPAVAHSDPGNPGVRSAADAVYDGPGILGDEPPTKGVNAGGGFGNTPVADNNGVTSLPFTGYAAGTVLLLGLAMAAVGLVLRRRTRSE